MKKVIAILLATVSVLSLFACSNKENPAPTEEKKDFSAYAGIVTDTKTWYDELMALPIANENMTEDELRQLCVDWARINSSFTWTPTEDISYTFNLQDSTSEVFLPKGIAYAGMCYNNNIAKGNVWKVLNYYDHETGALDVAAMDGSPMNIISSACARYVQWGWSRVSNSNNLDDMGTFSQYASNIVTVGPYTYAPGKYNFSGGDGTLQIVQENGSDIMCQSYAAMKPADGIYSSSSYHVMMCSAKPVVVTDANGWIDPDQSYLLVCEQDAVGSKTENKNSLQENGVTLRALGSVDNKYTFRQLMDKGYLPFTMKEFIGQDPVEAGDAWVGTQTSRIEDNADITLQDLLKSTAYSNYAICTLALQIRDLEGNVLYNYDTALQSQPNTFSTPLNNIQTPWAEPYANGSNTIHVMIRLANGELKDAVSTVLKLS